MIICRSNGGEILKENANQKMVKWMDGISNLQDDCIPKVRYPIGTQVYVSIGDLLIEGVIINTRFALGQNRIEYLVKYSKNFKDGITRGEWHFATDLSNLVVT